MMMWKFVLALWFAMYGLAVTVGFKLPSYLPVSGTIAIFIAVLIVFEETHYLRHMKNPPSNDGTRPQEKH